MDVWRFYGHDGCGRCIDALRRLGDLLEGQPLTVRIVEVDHDPRHRHGDDAPVLEDPEGDAVWAGAPDADRTMRAVAWWREKERLARAMS